MHPQLLRPVFFSSSDDGVEWLASNVLHGVVMIARAAQQAVIWWSSFWACQCHHMAKLLGIHLRKDGGSTHPPVGHHKEASRNPPQRLRSAASPDLRGLSPSSPLIVLDVLDFRTTRFQGGTGFANVKITTGNTPTKRQVTTFISIHVSRSPDACLQRRALSSWKIGSRRHICCPPISLAQPGVLRRTQEFLMRPHSLVHFFTQKEHAGSRVS